MIRIRPATDFTDKIKYSNYEDYETYPNSLFICDKCGDKVGVGYRDLDKHRFSKDSNLMDDLIAKMLSFQHGSEGMANFSFI